MTEQVTVTIDGWTFEYNLGLSGDVFIGGEFGIPMEVLLKFFMNLPIRVSVTANRVTWSLPDEFNSRIATTTIESGPGIYTTPFIAPDKLGPSVFLAPPLPGKRIDPEGER